MRRIAVIALLTTSPLWAACGQKGTSRWNAPPISTVVATPAPTPAARQGTPKRLRAASARQVGTGAWSYFGDPRAVYAHGRTFVGWTDARGYTNVVALRRTRLIEHVRLGPRFAVDDHNNPSLHVRPDGRIMVFYSQHNGRTRIRCASTDASG
jgi:hypothetical protein